MPGYGFADDELQKLFAEAGDAVKKKKAEPTPPAVSLSESTPHVEVAPMDVAPVAPPTVSAAPAAPAAAGEDEFMAPVALRPMAPPATTAAGAVRIMGGEQTDSGLVARTAAGDTVTLPWAQIKKLSLARIVSNNYLAFMSGTTMYYFSDENVAYKGLLKQMAATLNLNWRALVNELAARVSDASDPGLQALTGAGGMVPKHLDTASFFSAVRAR